MTISTAPTPPELLDSSSDSEQEISTSKVPMMRTGADVASRTIASDAIHTGSGYFVGKDGNKLFEQWWRPDKPKAAVVIVHGYSEHSGRYAHVAETFVKNGYAVYAYDHRSHGQSDGQDSYIASFDDVVDELGLFLAHIEERLNNLPLFVLGHSMGGLVVSLYTATRQPPVAGVILSGPYVKVNGDVPSWLVGIAGIVGRYLPNLPTIKLDYRLISRDEEILAKHQADPLIYRGKILARTGSEMNRAVQKINRIVERISVPLLVMHGGDDQIAPVSGSNELYAQVSSSDKRLKIYDGLYHEILNEVEREAVKADIVAWMDEHGSVSGESESIV